ncbi:TPA: hypothetical protein ACX6RK_001835 [Photobacterium damselae]
MSRLFYRLIISLLLVGLFGCGGSGDGSDENIPSKKISINAQDTLKLSQFNTQTMVDLRSRVQAENNESLLISDVKSINGDCDILSVDGLSFNVYSRHPDVCRFEYTVAPASGNYTGSAKALSQIVLNEDPKKGEYLHPISRTMLKNESVRFNSSDLVEPGYVLDPSSVFVLSGTGTSEIGKLSDISESGFTYQSPNIETVVRIFYSVINKTDNIVRPGIIYIAIGQNANISPSAQDRTLEAGSILEKMSINIEEFVSDADGDDLQLVYAKGIINDVDISGNLEFQYNPSSTGHEYITYIVSDHNGGYGIGFLDFIISTYPSISDTTQELIFLPPMTIASPELEVSSGSYYEVGIHGYQGFYPIFTHALASSYCITQGGRLPTEAELSAMWKNVINKPVFKSEFKWHSSLPYLTNIESKQVSLIDGQETSRTDPAYFSCVISTKEPDWEFSQSFAHSKLGVPTKINEIAHMPDGNTIYRDVSDYKLQAKTIRYLVNGKEVDPEDVNLEINADQITIDANVTPLDKVYIMVEVTDDDIIDKSVTITSGINQCTKDTTPEQSLKEGCIYTVGLENNVRFTLAIPTNIIGHPPEDLPSKTKIFGADGVTFIGTKGPNTEEWHAYLKDICNSLNSMKFDGRSNWTTGMDRNTFPMRTYVNDEEESKAMTSWLYYEMEHDSDAVDPKPADYGQGFAGLPGQDWVMNQDDATNGVIRQEYTRAYSPASCVSPK